MKKFYFITTLITLFYSTFIFSQVGINTETPNPKSILDIRSSDKGVLFPRLTTTQKNTITSLLNNDDIGLTIFNITTKCYNVWDGTSWYEACGSGKSSLAQFSINNATYSKALIVGEEVKSIITLEINATSVGTWSLSSNTINGVTFSGSGIITAPGIQLIKLSSSGTLTSTNNSSETIVLR